MPIPEPKLDDRTFQDLVDEAKAYIAQYCPEWTDHNVSDPGVTLIEVFAWMTDLLLWRLNRVPDKSYIRFMELLGVNMHTGAAAETDVTFYLTKQDEENDKVIPEGTQVATERTETVPALLFTTSETLTIPPLTLSDVQPFTEVGDGSIRQTDVGDEFPAFANPPVPGNAMYLALRRDVSQCLLRLQIQCGQTGTGGEDKTPLVWEALCAVDRRQEWVAAEKLSDNTAALTAANGSIELALPRNIVLGEFKGRGPYYWLRVRYAQPVGDQLPYVGTPTIRSIDGKTFGGYALAVHATVIENEELGRSSGEPGQRFSLERKPVLGPMRDDEHLAVTPEGKAPETWKRVEHFGRSRANDKHFTVDLTTGEIAFGPVIRQQGGLEQHFGAVPPANARLTMRRYRHGGGVAGNVAKNQITVLKSSIPYVARVENRRRAEGGLEPESLAAAKLRAYQMFRSRDRAVTKEDFEFLARQAEGGTEVARAHCVDPGQTDRPVRPGHVEVFIVPQISELSEPDLAAGREPALLRAKPQLCDSVRDYLQSRCILGVTVHVRPVELVTIDVAVNLVAARRARREDVRSAVKATILRYLDPLHGGAEQQGWPFGRPLLASEMLATIQEVEEVEYVTDLTLMEVGEGDNRQSGQQIKLHADQLLLPSQVTVTIVDPA